jgi:thioredoxin reductase (NADPH)
MRRTPVSRVVLVDKGCLCNSLFHYPAHMTFFTTPELLEIGNIPFPSPNPKPNRNEALQYYRQVAEHYKLDVRQYQTVERSPARTASFRCIFEDRFDRAGTLPGAQAGRLHRLLRPAQLSGIPGES